MNTDRDTLIEAARRAAANAHAPYSGYHVGAALRLTDGQILAGCNMENASYGLTLCAEAVALGAATSAGRLADIAEIAIIGGHWRNGALEGDAPVRPCGRCRQLIAEAAQLSGRDTPIHCASGDGKKLASHTISELLPHAFGPGDLG